MLDVVPNQGKQSISTIADLQFTDGIDFLVDFNQDKDSKVSIDPYYDIYCYLYGHNIKMFETATGNEKKASNVLAPILYILNKGFYLPKGGNKFHFKHMKLES